MRGKYRSHHILEVVLLFIALAGFSASNSKANENSKYLDAVREFADNVLKYGRDTYGPKHTTYGPKHTPLFVDGLNIHTHEPVKWISPIGDWQTATETEEWIISNFASQQTLLRTMDGLSEITGDAKYRQAATDAVRYEFDHVRTPSGLFFWGHITAYDALRDTPCGNTSRESIKLHYPYYELMWKVDPEATKNLIEALWCAHILDWSNLDFNRSAPTTANLKEPWNHKYANGPAFFKSKYGGYGFANTATSLIQAGTTLYRLSHQEQPLVWSKRLAKRFIDTRHPKTGISLPYYNNTIPPLGDDLKEHFQNPHTVFFPWHPFAETRYLYYPENIDAQIWLSLILIGDTLGKNGREFTQWAIEELTAWSKASYRKKDNSFVPILTDGTDIEGYVSKEYTTYASKGAIAKPLFADLTFFWAYAAAYRATNSEFMWEIIRNIALGNKLGDVGETPAHTPELQTSTTSSNVYGLLGFLELYSRTINPEFLQMAQHIGDNIVRNQFYRGFFVPSKRHIYTRFDCFEPLALLNLHAAIKSKRGPVPQVWPSCPLFVPSYRYKQQGVDRLIIYALTESPELPISLQEAAAIGDINLVRTLIETGTDVDVLDDGFRKTALHRAAMGGHKNIVELLLARGADVSARDQWPFATPLHYAVENGHKEIAELLIASGADINVKDTRGRTPIDLAMNQGRKEIAKLLLSKSGDVSLLTAAYIGDLQRVEKFIDDGANVDAKDQKGQTALHYAAKAGQIAVAKLLIANGADVNVNAGEWTPLQEAAYYSKEMVELLLAKGANINTGKWTALHSALDAERFDIVELLIAKGADVNIKDGKGRTPLHIAAWYAASKNPKIVELLLSKGADINAKNNNGKTALSYATDNGHTEIVELLRKHGAKE